MKNMYTEKVLDHFRNPRNMGKMENPDGIGKVGNPKCGDVMVIYIKVKDNKISDIKLEMKLFGFKRIKRKSKKNRIRFWC